MTSVAITVKYRSKEASFNVYRATLTRHAPSLAALVSTTVLETKSGASTELLSLKIADVCFLPHEFQLFVRWLYLGDLPELDSSWGMEAYAQHWVFGAKHKITHLQNEAMKRLTDFFTNLGRYIEADDYFISNTVKFFEEAYGVRGWTTAKDIDVADADEEEGTRQKGYQMKESPF